MASNANPTMTTDQWQGTALGWFACFLGTALTPFVAILGLVLLRSALGYVPSLGVALVGIAGAVAVWRNVGRRAGRPRNAAMVIFAAVALGGLTAFAVYWELAVVSPM
jgi:hypothetical protein